MAMRCELPWCLALRREDAYFGLSDCFIHFGIRKAANIQKTVIGTCTLRGTMKSNTPVCMHTTMMHSNGLGGDVLVTVIRLCDKCNEPASYTDLDTLEYLCVTCHESTRKVER